MSIQLGIMEWGKACRQKRILLGKSSSGYTHLFYLNRRKQFSTQNFLNLCLISCFGQQCINFLIIYDFEVSILQARAAQPQQSRVKVSKKQIKKIKPIIGQLYFLCLFHLKSKLQQLTESYNQQIKPPYCNLQPSAQSRLTYHLFEKLDLNKFIFPTFYPNYQEIHNLGYLTKSQLLGYLFIQIKFCKISWIKYRLKLLQMKSQAKATSKQNDQSLISSLYSYWQQYKIPAIFYHYTLSILPLKPKHEQITFMQKEIKLLKLGTHPYHVISDLITAREQSLEIILKNAQVLSSSSNDVLSQIDSQYERQYSIVSRNKGKVGKRYIQLVNNIKMFRKMTIEVVFRIYAWAKQLHENEYKGVIQFLYKHQDYLQKVSQDISEVISQYDFLFENNPLLIMKKQHQHTQYAFIHQYLKISQEEAIKIHKILQIITTHHAILENKRLLGIFKHSDSRKTLKIANPFQKIYCSYNRSQFLEQEYNINDKKPQNQYQNAYPQNFSERPDSTLYLDKKMALKENGRSKSQAVIIQPTKLQLSNQNLQNITETQLMTGFELSFQFQTNLQKENLYNYLRNNIFKTKKIDTSQIQIMSRAIIQYRDSITLIKMKAGDLLVGWIAAVFIPKDQFFRRVVNIIYLQKLVKFPGFWQQVIKKFKQLDYGIIKQDGRVLYEHSSLPPKTFSLISINWQIMNSKKERLKKLAKEHKQLKCSRLLKYYSYSNQTKYHKYCQHTQNSCTIKFEFDAVSKITIDGKAYFKAKCDKIEKVGDAWKIQHHLNQLHLILTKKLQAILHFQKNRETSSQKSSQNNTKIYKTHQKKYLCLPQIKKIKKYVDSYENQLVIQKVAINQNFAATLSISTDKNELKNCLIVEQQFFLAFVCSDQQDYGKTVAVALIN